MTDPLNPYAEPRAESVGEQAQRFADEIRVALPKLSNDEALAIAKFAIDVTSHLSAQQKRDVAEITAKAIKWFLTMKAGLG